jgi:hypothetical protein
MSLLSNCCCLFWFCAAPHRLLNVISCLFLQVLVAVFIIGLNQRIFVHFPVQRPVLLNTLPLIRSAWRPILHQSAGRKHPTPSNPHNTSISTPAATTTTPPTFWLRWKQQIPCSILNSMTGSPPRVSPAGCAPFSPAAFLLPPHNGPMFFPDTSAVPSQKSQLPLHA